MKHLSSGILLNVGSIFISLISIPLILNNIGLSNYGKITFLSITCSYSFIFDLGASRFLVNKNSKSKPQINSARVMRVMTASVLIISALFLTASLAFILVNPRLNLYEVKIPYALMYVYPLSVASLLQRIISLKLQSEEKHNQFISMNFLLTLTTPLVTLPASYFVNEVFYILFLIGVAKILILMKYISFTKVKVRKNLIWYRVLLSKSLPSFGSYLSNIITGYLDKALMAIFLPSAMGAYMLANQVVEKSTIIPSVHSSLTYKRFSYMSRPEFFAFFKNPYLVFAALLFFFLMASYYDYGLVIPIEYQTALEVGRYLLFYYFFVGLNIYCYNYSIAQTNVRHLIKIDVILMFIIIVSYPMGSILFGIKGLLWCMIFKAIIEHLIHSVYYKFDLKIIFFSIVVLLIINFWL